MHDAGARQQGLRRPRVQQAVEQRSPPMAGCRMDDQTRGLVDHQQSRILVDDLDRHRVGFEGMVRFARQGLNEDRLVAGQARLSADNARSPLHTAPSAIQC
jgi:hypothetical protein